MKPFFRRLRNYFLSGRILGQQGELNGLVKADRLLSQLVAEERVPGISITVRKHGALFLQKGYGFADLEKKIPVNPQTTIFRAASISKPIAATAMARMVAEGKISLEDSIYTYLPYFPRKKYDMTLRQLAGHTAGIRAYRGKEYALNKPYSIKDSLEVFQDDPLLFEPGEGYQYNSYGWVLLSLAMQEACGKPFEDCVFERVLEPLEMRSTFPEVSVPERAPAFRGSKAIFYTKTARGFRKAVAVHNAYKLAGGGYLSTSADIARLGQAYLDGKITSEKVISEFLSPQRINGNSTYYGLGWQVSEDSMGRPYYGHVGNSVGGYSNFFVYPEQQIVLAILINCTDPKVQEELDEAVCALLE